MSPDSILNLLWVLVVVGSLAAWAVAELRRRSGPARRARFRQGVAVLVATVALFPTISASDDVLCLRQLPMSGLAQRVLNVETPGQPVGTAGHYLAQLLQVAENFRPGNTGCVTPALTCFALIPSLREIYSGRSLPSASERGPPLFS